MIRLRCGNCGETLEVDDAFAGGVCRCQHCGTIQTVPAKGAQDNASGEPVASAQSPRALYRREEHQEHAASGLDELADVVASSGALSSGLHRTATRRRRRSGKSSPSLAIEPSVRVDGRGKPGTDRRLIAAIAVAATLAVVAVGLGVALLSDGDGSASPDAPDATTGGPMLGTVALPASVSFVLDTGSATQQDFPALADLTLDLADRLPDGGQYQVVLWPQQRVGESVLSATSLPSAQLRTAADRSVERTRERIGEIPLGGSTLALPALDVALAANPDAVVLATGNTAFLPPDFAQTIVDRWKAAGAKMPIHALAVGTDAAPIAFEEIAEATGGEAIAMTRSELRAARRAMAARTESSSSP